MSCIRRQSLGQHLSNLHATPSHGCARIESISCIGLQHEFQTIAGTLIRWGSDHSIKCSLFCCIRRSGTDADVSNAHYGFQALNSGECHVRTDDPKETAFPTQDFGFRIQFNCHLNAAEVRSQTGRLHGSHIDTSMSYRIAGLQTVTLREFDGDSRSGCRYGLSGKNNSKNHSDKRDPPHLRPNNPFGAGPVTDYSNRKFGRLFRAPPLITGVHSLASQIACGSNDKDAIMLIVTYRTKSTTAGPN